MINRTEDFQNILELMTGKDISKEPNKYAEKWIKESKEKEKQLEKQGHQARLKSQSLKRKYLTGEVGYNKAFMANIRSGAYADRFRGENTPEENGDMASSQQFKQLGGQYNMPNQGGVPNQLRTGMSASYANQFHQNNEGVGQGAAPFNPNANINKTTYY